MWKIGQNWKIGKIGEMGKINKEQDAIFKHSLVGGSSLKWPENVAMSFWE